MNQRQDLLSVPERSIPSEGAKAWYTHPLMLVPLQWSMVTVPCDGAVGCRSQSQGEVKVYTEGQLVL